MSTLRRSTRSAKASRRNSASVTIGIERVVRHSFVATASRTLAHSQRPEITLIATFWFFPPIAMACTSSRGCQRICSQSSLIGSAETTRQRKRSIMPCENSPRLAPRSRTIESGLINRDRKVWLQIRSVEANIEPSSSDGSFLRIPHDNQELGQREKSLSLILEYSS